MKRDFKRDLFADFWDRVLIGDGCWEWQGPTYRGYGRHFLPIKQPVRAHRHSYAQLVGEIPAGFDLHHTCGNRGCVRPDHLEPVEHTAHRHLHVLESEVN